MERMKQRDHGGRAAGLTGLLGVTGIAAVAAAVGGWGAGCGESVFDLCDPANFIDGYVDPDCCDPTATMPPLDPRICCNPMYYRFGKVPADICCNPADYLNGQVPTDICPVVDAGDAGPGDAGAGAGDAGDAAADAPIVPCAGQCIQGPPPGWTGPDLVWIGPEGEAPPCPAGAPVDGYDGHTDLDAPGACSACQCGPPGGSCGLPATLTASTTTCAGADAADAGAVHTPFDPPVGWDGGCTAGDAVDAGAACDGGPCVQSLTIGSLVLVESGCAPGASGGSLESPASWMTSARGCQGWLPGWCGDPGHLCAPAGPPGDGGEGFRVCIFHDGDTACPLDGPYQERHVFYEGFADARSCAACTCGVPIGGACIAEISIYADSACASTPGYVETIDATGPACHDLVAGTALGSKAASPPVYTPGACQAGGGEPMGDASPVDPSTYCCVPTP
jgi:hypothetical protein